MEGQDRSLLSGLLSSPPAETSGPVQTAFSQQRLEAWRPLFTPVIVATLTIIGGILFLGIGVVLWLSSQNQFELDIRYDNKCNCADNCTIALEIPRRVQGHVILAYRLTRYPQNHQRYFTSRSYPQLSGAYVDYDGMGTCGDYRTHDPDDPENTSAWILPCGAVARSFFNDTFRFVDLDEKFSSTGIAWRSDRQKLFKKLSDDYKNGDRWLETQWMNNTFPDGTRNEHFIVWMREAILQEFTKPYSRCTDCDIAAGNYTLEIGNNYKSPNCSKKLFQGEKHVVLTTVGLFGSKNDALAIAYFVVGGLLVLSGIVVTVSHIACPRPLGEGRGI